MQKVKDAVTAFNTTNQATYGTITLGNIVVQTPAGVTISADGTSLGDTKTQLKVVADISYTPPTTGVPTGVVGGVIFQNEPIYTNQSIIKSENETLLDNVSAVTASFTQNRNSTYVNAEFIDTKK